MRNLYFALLLALVCTVTPVLAATPQLTEKAIVNGGFGPAPDQYGRAGLGTSTRTTRLVNCFAASPTYIAVHDRLKRDVKVYTPAGVFGEAIRLRLTGAKPDTVRARDIAIDKDVLYVLVDDQSDGSKKIPPSMRIATFDLGTGVCRDVRTLDTSLLASGPATARGADAYFLHPDGKTLWFEDSINQMSFEVGSGNPAQLAKRPVFGWGSEHRVRTDDNASTINLLDSTGKVLRRMPGSGVLVAVSQDGSAFAVMQTAGGADWRITVFNSDGDVLAQAPRPNRNWKPFKPPVVERKYELVSTPAGAELYELYAGADGVHVVHWAR
ncbi:MAG TPA: hypothetical protein VFH88_04210 [Candidatus Krumholzibacteria bacterium]|nr:hypothetical protein [Candidatus Krumholzibacteria bacterium]